MIEAWSEGGDRGTHSDGLTGRPMARTAAMSSPPEAAPTRAVSPEAGTVEAPPVRGVGACGGLPIPRDRGSAECHGVA
jgi:hypothetical protein